MKLSANGIGLIFAIMGAGVYLFGLSTGHDSKEVSLALITAGAGIVNTGEIKTPDRITSPPSEKKDI